MEKKFKLLPPIAQNFIQVEINNTTKTTIPISDLTTEEAENYAELIKQTFLNHYKKRKTK